MICNVWSLVTGRRGKGMLSSSIRAVGSREYECSRRNTDGLFEEYQAQNTTVIRHRLIRQLALGLGGRHALVLTWVQERRSRKSYYCECKLHSPAELGPGSHESCSFVPPVMYVGQSASTGNAIKGGAVRDDHDCRHHHGDLDFIVLGVSCVDSELSNSFWCALGICVFVSEEMQRSDALSMLCYETVCGSYSCHA